MLVDIDYETICVNCKEKGYSFGYSLKTISYLGELVLDLPQRYLNGPCLAFNYRSIPFLMRSIENSHSLNNESTQPIFAMINAKHNKNSTISRFTYRYSAHNHPDIKQLNKKSDNNPEFIYEYVDVYRFPDKPFIFLFYSFQNKTRQPLHSFNFYQLYDFDIYGQDFYDSDRAGFDEKTLTIYQYDSRYSLDNSIIAGITSLGNNPPTHFEANSPESILINSERLNLRDYIHPESSDLAVGMQWSISTLEPEQIINFPIAMVFGKGLKNFQENIQMAKPELQKLQTSVLKAISIPSRQLVDPKLENLSFSLAEWCKD